MPLVRSILVILFLSVLVTLPACDWQLGWGDRDNDQGENKDEDENQELRAGFYLSKGSNAALAHFIAIYRPNQEMETYILMPDICKITPRGGVPTTISYFRQYADRRYDKGPTEEIVEARQKDSGGTETCRFRVRLLTRGDGYPIAEITLRLKDQDEKTYKVDFRDATESYFKGALQNTIYGFARFIDIPPYQKGIDRELDAFCQKMFNKDCDEYLGK